MQKNDTFINKHWEKINRQPCQVYTRVMWYLRPVSFFNVWKKAEFYSRKYFLDTTQTSEDLRKRENAKFISQYR